MGTKKRNVVLAPVSLVQKLLTLFSLEGGGHIVPALTLTNYNF